MFHNTLYIHTHQLVLRIIFGINFLYLEKNHEQLNILQGSGSGALVRYSSAHSTGVLLGILGEDVPLGSPNPDPNFTPTCGCPLKSKPVF